MSGLMGIRFGKKDLGRKKKWKNRERKEKAKGIMVIYSYFCSSCKVILSNRVTKIVQLHQYSCSLK